MLPIVQGVRIISKLLILFFSASNENQFGGDIGIIEWERGWESNLVLYLSDKSSPGRPEARIFADLTTTADANDIV
jgi:hypothetical protein